MDKLQLPVEMGTAAVDVRGLLAPGCADDVAMPVFS